MKHGTPVHEGPSLCETCRNATHIKGLAESQDYVICDSLSGEKDLIRFKVRECSKYDDMRQPSLRAMQQIAWKLATDKSGRKIGFLSPVDFARRSRKDGDVEGEGDHVLNPITGDVDYL